MNVRRECNGIVSLRAKNSYLTSFSIISVTFFISIFPSVLVFTFPISWLMYLGFLFFFASSTNLGFSAKTSSHNFRIFDASVVCVSPSSCTICRIEMGLNQMYHLCSLQCNGIIFLHGKETECPHRKLTSE